MKYRHHMIPWSYLLFTNILLAASCCFAQQETLNVPEGYVLQLLEETDGKIARPIDWFYTSEETPSGLLWILSAEDPSKGSYETGMRIQLLSGMEKHIKKSAHAFAQDFIEKKRKSTAVVRECPETNQGLFTRQCLEVIEALERPSGTNSFHIVYSVFWDNNLDSVVITTFGTPQDKWEEVKKISEVMSSFELIGPNFLEKLEHKTSLNGTPNSAADEVMPDSGKQEEIM